MLEENMMRWRQSVLREGRLEGRREGRREGRERGQVEGMRYLLLQMMKQRFGPLPLPVRRQIRAMSALPELEDLARRLLTANSLSDLGFVSQQQP